MNDFKIILGIETSCDETAAAILKKEKNGLKVLSNIIASSAPLQSKFGGIIPEQAAREQLKFIIPVIETAISDSGKTINEIDAIAVTCGPGLIGSLLVGVETAKTIALIWNKPLIPINHLTGHFYANWIVDDFKSAPSFPCLGLLVSGGHTDLVLFSEHNKYEYLGGTRDDAAGECFDKCARLMNLPYPGGPEISKLSLSGKASKIRLPRPMANSKDLDFSFSGLKTAVANYIQKNKNYKPEDLAASIQETIVQSLLSKTLQAISKYEVNRVMLAGGVAANKVLSDALRGNSHVQLFSPSHNIYCTDNAAMIAAAGFCTEKIIDPLNLQADPNLSLLLTK